MTLWNILLTLVTLVVIPFLVLVLLLLVAGFLVALCDPFKSFKNTKAFEDTHASGTPQKPETLQASGATEVSETAQATELSQTLEPNVLVSETLDITPLFVTNRSPKTAEIVALQQAVVDLEEKISSLLTEKRILDAQLSLHRTALSAVRRVPPEVWGQIFSHTLAAKEDTFLARALSDKGRRAQERLAALSLVCSSWRTAALATQSLWADIDIHGGKSFMKVPVRRDSPRAFTLAKVKGWLERAGSAPKSLSVSGEGIYAKVVLELFIAGPVLDSVQLEWETDLRPMCSYLHIMKDARGRAREQPRRGDGAVTLPWDHIRHLTLDFEATNWTMNGKVPEGAFLADLPLSITSLCLRLPKQTSAFDAKQFGPVDVSKVPLGVSPSLSQGLVSLEMSCDWDGQHLLQALGHCTSLEVLTSCNPTGNSEVRNTTSQLGIQIPIVLSKLRRLHLLGHHDLTFLLLIRAPALTSIDIDFKTLDQGSNHNEKQTAWKFDKTGVQVLLRFAAASSVDGNISTLCLSNAAIDSEDLAKIISAVNSQLTHLTLDEVAVDFRQLWSNVHANVIKAKATRPSGLTASGAGPASKECRVLPKLEVLKLRHNLRGRQLKGTVSEEFTVPLFTMLQQRGPSAKKTLWLKLVNTSWMGLWPGTVQEDWMTAAVGGGVTVSRPRDAGVKISIYRDWDR